MLGGPVAMRMTPQLAVAAFLLIFMAHVAIAVDSRPTSVKSFEAKHPGVLHVGGDVKAPKLKRKVSPKWPDDLRLRFQELDPIIVEIVVTVGGEVEDPTVVGTLHAQLDPLALDAIQQW